MDKFSSISLFDFFSFLVPGFILQAAIVFCWQLSGCTVSFHFSFITGNEALAFVLLSIAAYLLGHCIHYASSQFAWLGTSALKKNINSYSLLNQEKYLAESLNKQGKTSSAQMIRREFEKAWRKADTVLRIEDLYTGK